MRRPPRPEQIVPFRRPPLVAALLLATGLVVPSRAAAPAPFSFARRVVGAVTAPVERTYAVPPGALLAGVTWASGDAAVWVRSGPGAWERLENEPAETGRPGTEPHWVAALSLLTVRIVPTGAVSGAAVDFAGGGSSASSASATTRSLPRLGSVVTRAGWGADESLRTSSRSYTTPLALTVHHTVTANGYAHADAPSYIRAVYAYHTRSRGWDDIGYNLLVDRFGTVYEGRWGGFDRGVMGTHAAGFNTNTLGVSLLGNYDAEETPAAMTDAVARAGAWAAQTWRWDPRSSVTLTSRGGTKYRSGTRVTLPRVFGHRDVGTTACPGRYAYAHLPAIRGAAWAKLRAVFSKPVVTGAPVRAPKPVKIAASLDHAAWWAATIKDSSGNVLVSVKGKGTKVAVSWDGVQAGTGLPAVPGTTYTWRLTADDRVHGASVPVKGTFEAGLPSVVP
jgi:uncharacterized protein with LGFP repeats